MGWDQHYVQGSPHKEGQSGLGIIPISSHDRKSGNCKRINGAGRESPVGEGRFILHPFLLLSLEEGEILYGKGGLFFLLIFAEKSEGPGVEL